MNASGSQSGLEQQLQELQSALAAAEDRLARALQERNREEVGRQQLAAIVEASRDAIWSWNKDGVITSWNGEAERLFQYRADEIVGQSLLLLVPPERLEKAHAAIAKLRDGDWFEQYDTVRLRKDGIAIPVELTVSPIRDSQGSVVGAATVCRDITERKRLEVQQDLLRQELNHRIKNTLATVYALLQQSKRTADSDVVGAFEGRLHTLMRTHDAFAGNESAGRSLRALIEGELKAFCSNELTAVTVAGEDIVLSRDVSQMICLALHELAANATRHGALSNEHGRISIAWRRVGQHPQPQVNLEWREEGGPRVPEAPARRGFGRLLLESGLARALGGTATLEFAPEGLRYQITFPDPAGGLR